MSVSISSAYSKLTNKPSDPDKAKIRGHVASQRTTLGHFIHNKFCLEEVGEKLSEYGFKDGNYKKIIVVWDWVDGVEEALERKASSFGGLKTLSTNYPKD